MKDTFIVVGSRLKSVVVRQSVFQGALSICAGYPIVLHRIFNINDTYAHKYFKVSLSQALFDLRSPNFIPLKPALPMYLKDLSWYFKVFFNS